MKFYDFNILYIYTMLSWVTHMVIFKISRISTDFKAPFLKRKNVSLIKCWFQNIN